MNQKEIYLERKLRTVGHNQWVRIPIDKEIKINRSVKSSVRLISTYVSREHAVLCLINGSVYAKDCGSLYGIHVNNERIPVNQLCVIRPGDMVEIARPAQDDPIWNSITLEDRFVYSVLEEDKNVLNCKNNAARQQYSALFNRQNKKNQDVNASHNVTQPENYDSIIKNQVSVSLNDITKETSSIKREAKMPQLKKVQVSLDKSGITSNMIIEQENKRLKMELEQKESEINDRDNKIKGLETITHQTVDIVDAMETELQCTICNEIFIRATTLNCMHTFCEFCITQWKKRKMECPICRQKIKTSTRTLFVDNYVERVIQGLSDQMKKERECVIQRRVQDAKEYLALIQNKNKPNNSTSSTQPRRRRGRGRRRNNNLANTGIPVIRMQAINFSNNPHPSDVVIVEDDGPRTQFQASLNNMPSRDPNDVIVIL